VSSFLKIVLMSCISFL